MQHRVFFQAPQNQISTAISFSLNQNDCPRNWYSVVAVSTSVSLPGIPLNWRAGQKFPNFLHGRFGACVYHTGAQVIATTGTVNWFTCPSLMQRKKRERRKNRSARRFGKRQPLRIMEKCEACSRASYLRCCRRWRGRGDGKVRRKD